MSWTLFRPEHVAREAAREARREAAAAERRARERQEVRDRFRGLTMRATYSIAGGIDGVILDWIPEGQLVHVRRPNGVLQFVPAHLLRVQEATPASRALVAVCDCDKTFATECPHPYDEDPKYVDLAHWKPGFRPLEPQPYRDPAWAREE